MHHIENGECVQIRPDRLLVEQQKVLMRKEALEVLIAPAVPSLVDMDEDDDGGVQLPMTCSDLNRETMANQPDSKTANTNGLVDRYWPKLRETGLENGMSDLLNFSTASGNGNENEINKENIPGWVSKGRNHTFLELPSAKASASVSAAGAGAESKFESGTLAASALGPPLSVGISNAGVELARIYKDWNPGNFIDGFTGEYVCACGKRCLIKEEFEKHVLTES